MGEGGEPRQVTDGVAGLELVDEAGEDLIVVGVVAEQTGGLFQQRQRGSVVAALAQGRFVDVSGTAASAVVPFEEHDVKVRGLTYQASDIRLVSTSEAVIGDLKLTGTLGYAALSDIAELPVSSGGDGRVLVTYSVDVLGLNALKIGVSAVPVLDAAAQQIDLQQARIDVAGIDLNETVSQQIIDRVVKPISLAVDDQVKVTAIRVADDGLVADLTATDVPIKR